MYDDPTLPGPANGEVRGDSKSIPNRGTGSGVVPNGTYGADLGANATNRMGAVGDTDSDPMDRCVPMGGGDFTSRGHTTSDPGGRMSGTGSDPMDDTTPGDEGMPGDRD
jgi:hypothetical protein